MTTEYKKQTVGAQSRGWHPHRVVREAGVQIRGLMPALADVVRYFLGYFKELIIAYLFFSFSFILSCNHLLE